MTITPFFCDTNRAGARLGPRAVRAVERIHAPVLVVSADASDAVRQEAEALDCVFGYACGLDMTRRDLQLAARELRRPWDWWSGP